MWKLGPREGKWFAQVHTAEKEADLESEPRLQGFLSLPLDQSS